MALRIAYPGACYHLITRGNNKADMFLDDSDRYKYLSLLALSAAKFEIKMYVYALMSNHVHICAETPKGNVSPWMFEMNLGYTKYFNTRHCRTGHLLERRFNSRLVQKDRYLLALLRYIHRNPVKAGLAGSTEDYVWSSYRAYLRGSDGVVKNPLEILNLFSDNLSRARELYVEFMNRHISEKEWKLLSSERNGFLGDCNFTHSFSKR